MQAQTQEEAPNALASLRSFTTSPLIKLFNSPAQIAANSCYKLIYLFDEGEICWGKEGKERKKKDNPTTTKATAQPNPNEMQTTYGLLEVSITLPCVKIQTYSGGRMSLFPANCFYTMDSFLGKQKYTNLHIHLQYLLDNRSVYFTSQMRS